jgi:hypothetical protein
MSDDSKKIRVRYEPGSPGKAQSDPRSESSLPIRNDSTSLIYRDALASLKKLSGMPDEIEKLAEHLKDTRRSHTITYVLSVVLGLAFLGLSYMCVSMKIERDSLAVRLKLEAQKQMLNGRLQESVKEFMQFKTSVSNELQERSAMVAREIDKNERLITELQKVQKREISEYRDAIEQRDLSIKLLSDENQRLQASLKKTPEIKETPLPNPRRE